MRWFISCLFIKLPVIPNRLFLMTVSCHLFTFSKTVKKTRLKKLLQAMHMHTQSDPFLLWWWKSISPSQRSKLHEEHRCNQVVVHELYCQHYSNDWYILVAWEQSYDWYMQHIDNYTLEWLAVVNADIICSLKNDIVYTCNIKKKAKNPTKTALAWKVLIFCYYVWYGDVLWLPWIVLWI